MNIKELAEELGLEEEEYLELIELFLDRSMSDLNELNTAVETKDAEKAASVAHSIKGAAGNLGLMELYEEAKKIEAQAREGSLEGVVEFAQTVLNGLEEIAALTRG